MQPLALQYSNFYYTTLSATILIYYKIEIIYVERRANYKQGRKRPTVVNEMIKFLATKNNTIFNTVLVFSHSQTIN